METGIVKKVIDTNTALVSIVIRGECSSCKAQKTCCDGVGDPTGEVEVKFNDDIKEGDEVNIDIKPQLRILTSIIIFLIPVVFLFAFYFLGFTLFKSEGIATLFSFLGLGISFLLIFVFFKLNKNSKKFVVWATKKM